MSSILSESSTSEHEIKKQEVEEEQKTFAPPTLSDHKKNILHYLLTCDFKKQVDILELMNLEGFEITEEEEDFNCGITHCLKLIKIVMYQIGM